MRERIKPLWVKDKGNYHPCTPTDANDFVRDCGHCDCKEDICCGFMEHIILTVKKAIQDEYEKPPQTPL